MGYSLDMGASDSQYSMENKLNCMDQSCLLNPLNPSIKLQILLSCQPTEE